MFLAGQILEHTSIAPFPALIVADNAPACACIIAESAITSSHSIHFFG